MDKPYESISESQLTESAFSICVPPEGISLALIAPLQKNSSQWFLFFLMNDQRKYKCFHSSCLSYVPILLYINVYLFKYFRPGLYSSLFFISFLQLKSIHRTNYDIWIGKSNNAKQYQYTHIIFFQNCNISWIYTFLLLFSQFYRKREQCSV